MILKKKNPTGLSTNMLNIKEIDGLCCGDKNCALTKKYMAVIDTTKTTTVSSITLGGTVVSFGITIDITTPTGVAMLQTHIDDAINSLGYEPDGVSVKLVGTDLVIKTYWSQLAFDLIGEQAFTCVDAMTVGDLLNCNCKDAVAVPTLVPPVCYAVDKVYAADGSLVEIRATSGLVLTSWLDDGTTDGTLFAAGGAAAVALDGAGFNWTFDGTNLVICEPSCPLANIYNATADEELAAFIPHGDVLVCFKVVGCKKVTNVSIGCGGTEIYNGSLTPDACANNAGVTISGCVICINATELELDGTKKFDIVISMEGCDDVTICEEVNF